MYPSVTTIVSISDRPADAQGDEPAMSADIAFERAFEEHWTGVFRFALAWTNDWTAAEDLSQEAFLRLWNGRDRLDWSRPALPWLLVTTRRLATDRFRALRRHLAGSLREDDAGAGDPALRARWLDVSAGLAVLSPLERSALVMTAIEGMSYDDAAAVLDTTAGALRAAVSRARAKLENA